jgi:GH25 family lysozyme M1 (1,4-beta-N-acetylmuramidase)
MAQTCFVADLYHLNPVDFNELKAASWNGCRVEAIIHKACQGAGVPDKEYPKRRLLATAAGFLWGAYAFNTGENVASQVAEFLKVAAPDAHTAMFLDFEDNRASEMTLAQMVEFLDRTEQAIGRHCRTYSGNRLKELIVHATAAQLEFLAKCSDRLWGCEYSDEWRNVDAAGRPLPWKAPLIWQRTGDGRGPQPHTFSGLQQNADLSTFNGTREQLEAVWPGAPLVLPTSGVRTDEALARETAPTVGVGAFARAVINTTEGMFKRGW